MSSPPRTPPTKRAKLNTPDTESTVAYGSVKTESTAIGSQPGSPSNESYRTPSTKSSAHDSLQASRGKYTPTTVPHSLFHDGSFKYPSSGKEPSSDAPVSPLTYSPQTRRTQRNNGYNGGKKTARKNKNKKMRTRKNKNNQRRRRT